MREEGTVIGAGDSSAVLEVKGHDECHKCGLCRIARSRRIVVSGKDAKGLKTGDKVEITLEGPVMMKLYLLIYGVPLAAFAGTALLLHAATGSPVLSLIGGAVAIVATYFAANIYIKRSGDFTPRVRRLP